MPTPDVPAALSFFSKVAVWMRSSRKTGGLGYSAAQVTQTNVYKGLIALGATAAIATGTVAIVDPPVFIGSEPTPPISVVHGPANCFNSPGSCGFPDPAYGNVGVPAGVALSTHAGSLTTTSNGQVINAVKVTGGQIVVNTNNVTIMDSEVVVSGGLGCETVVITGGHTGTLIEDSELHGTAAGSPYTGPNTNDSTTCENGVSNFGGGTVTMLRDYIFNVPDGVQYGASITDSYILTNGNIYGAGSSGNSHNEDVYGSDSTITLTHDTLLNPAPQTAEVFNDTNGGGGGPCDNHLTLKNSLLAGGGFMLYPCGNASSVGSSTMDVENNRFSRCTGAPITHNSGTGGDACNNAGFGGADTHGYWPYGGYFGLDANVYCTGAGQTWTSNVWDDDGSTISC